MSDQPDVRPEDALRVAQRALDRIADHEEDTAALEERVAELEAELGLEDSQPEPDYDSRDQAIVERLEPGETITVSELRQLYRRHTDIRSEKTLKRRMKGLVDRPEFEIADIGEIRYDPETNGGASA